MCWPSPVREARNAFRWSTAASISGNALKFALASLISHASFVDALRCREHQTTGRISPLLLSFYPVHGSWWFVFDESPFASLWRVSLCDLFRASYVQPFGNGEARPTSKEVLQLSLFCCRVPTTRFRPAVTLLSFCLSFVRLFPVFPSFRVNLRLS